MKKFFTSLTLLLFAAAAFAQAPQFPVDFESTTITYTFNDFAGGAASVIDNPQSSGINTSSKVGQMVKSAGEVFGGTALPLDGIIDFGDNNAIKMKVLANRVGASVLLKLEGPGGTTTGDIFATTTVANQWEEVTFSLAGLTSIEYNTIVIIYELGTIGDGGPDFTFWFDDIELTTAQIDGIQLPIDFESTTLSYEWANFGGGVTTVIENPDPSGINPSATVCEMIKFADQDFGGSALNLAGPIDFGTTAIIKMKVWANRVGAPVLFKLEGPGAPQELPASTTVANQWEELTYDFTGLVEAGIFNRVVIIYDLGVIGDGGPDFTLYFDDIQLDLTGAAVSLQDLGIEYFPNPATDLMTVKAPQNIDEITVYNLLGQPVFYEKGFNTVNTIDLSALKPGAYFLKVASDGKEGTAKIMVQ